MVSQTRFSIRQMFLIWWGHAAHDAVEDEVVERVTTRILSGMGFIALHASQKAKVFRRLMGTSCGLKWREAGEKKSACGWWSPAIRFVGDCRNTSSWNRRRCTASLLIFHSQKAWFS